MHRVYQRSAGIRNLRREDAFAQVREKMQTFLGDIHELAQGGSVIPGYEAAPRNWIRMCRRWIAISASFYSQRSVTRTWSSSRGRLVAGFIQRLVRNATARMGKGTRLSSSSTINGDILGFAFNGQSMSLRVCNARASRIPTKGDVRSLRFTVGFFKPSCHLSEEARRLNKGREILTENFGFLPKISSSFGGISGLSQPRMQGAGPLDLRREPIICRSLADGPGPGRHTVAACVTYW